MTDTAEMLQREWERLPEKVLREVPRAAALLFQQAGKEIERLLTTLDAREAQIARLRVALAKALDALIWASGSVDFQTDGKARLGWVNLGQPAIDEGAAVLTDTEPQR